MYAGRFRHGGAQPQYGEGHRRHRPSGAGKPGGGDRGRPAQEHGRHRGRPGGAVSGICGQARSGHRPAREHVGRTPNHGGSPQYPVPAQLSREKAEGHGGRRGGVADSGRVSGLQEAERLSYALGR